MNCLKYSFNDLGSISGLKGNEAVTVVITPSVMMWIDRYLDLRQKVLKVPHPDPESPFFINFNKKVLSDSGSVSLWKKFEAVTGVSHANVTSIR